MDNEITPPSDTREQVEEDIEGPISRYILKIVDPSTGKPWTPESGTLITGIDPIIGPEETINYDKEHKHFDQYGMLPVQYRIRAMTMSSRLRHDDLAKRYEQDTDTDG